MEESGNYKNKVELSEGCSLRYEHIFNKNRIPWNKNGRILAALSMDIAYSLKLLKLLCDTFTGRQRYKIILRPHGDAEISFDLERLFKEKEEVLDDLLEAVPKLAKSRGKIALVVFDEFQEISKLEEADKLERIIRSHIQKHQNQI